MGVIQAKFPNYIPRSVFTKSPNFFYCIINFKKMLLIPFKVLFLARDALIGSIIGSSSGSLFISHYIRTRNHIVQRLIYLSPIKGPSWIRYFDSCSFPVSETALPMVEWLVWVAFGK